MDPNFSLESSYEEVIHGRYLMGILRNIEQHPPIVLPVEPFIDTESRELDSDDDDDDDERRPLLQQRNPQEQQLNIKDFVEKLSKPVYVCWQYARKYVDIIIKQEALWQRKFIKNVYKESAAVACMSEEQVKMIREEFEISAYASKTLTTKIPNPVLDLPSCFEEFEHLITLCKFFKIQCPSPIQMQLWPCLLRGQNVIGVSPNASGKTLGYILPALVHVHYQPKCWFGTQTAMVLILAPTKILAYQIYAEINSYRDENIKTICITRDQSLSQQELEILRGVHIIVATLGRLVFFVSAGVLDVSNVSFFVVDEADALLTMEHTMQLDIILRRMRPERQTCMIMSTFPRYIRTCVDRLMIDPVLVCHKSLKLVTHPNLDHRVVFLDNSEDKFLWLRGFAMGNPGTRMLIFVENPVEGLTLLRKLHASGIESQIYHKDMHHYHFKQIKHDLEFLYGYIVITTDITARGIHLPGIYNLVNFSSPCDEIMYVQRAGRVGRNGRRSLVMTLVSQDHQSVAQMLAPLIEKSTGIDAPLELRTVALHGYNQVLPDEDLGNDQIDQDHMAHKAGG